MYIFPVYFQIKRYLISQKGTEAGNSKKTSDKGADYTG